MYHGHFKGTHYEAGYRWGSLLLKHQKIILDNIPFKITQERIDYALSCLPIYEKYYPKITEKSRDWQTGSIVMFVFCRQYCSVCTLCLQSATVPALPSLSDRKSFWGGTVIFLQILKRRI